MGLDQAVSHAGKTSVIASVRDNARRLTEDRVPRCRSLKESVEYSVNIVRIIFLNWHTTATERSSITAAERMESWFQRP